MKKRDVNIEALRCLSMFLVCVFHSLLRNAAYATSDSILKVIIAYVSGVVHIAVPCFVFISGYYGIKFSGRRVLSLVLMSLYGFTLSGVFMGGDEPYGSIWFLWAYISLMAMSPILEAAFKNMSPRGAIAMSVPFLFIPFVWSSLPHIPLLRRVVWLMTPGVVANSLLTLCGYYVVAKLYRMLNLERRLTIGVCVAIAVSAPFSWVIGLGGYDSIPTLLQAIAVFTLFRKWYPKKGLDAVLTCLEDLLVPSLFMVYVFHFTNFGRNMHIGLIKMLGEILPPVMSEIVVGIVIFACGIIYDIPRRLFVFVLRRIQDGMCRRCFG